MRAYRGITSNHAGQHKAQAPQVAQVSVDLSEAVAGGIALFAIKHFIKRCKANSAFEEDPICVMATELNKMEKELGHGVAR